MIESKDLPELAGTKGSRLVLSPDPQMRVYLATKGDHIDPNANGAFELLHHSPHDNCWWERIQVQVLQHTALANFGCFLLNLVKVSLMDGAIAGKWEGIVHSVWKIRMGTSLDTTSR